MIDTSNIKLIPATIEDYSIIQRMWPFYVYDLGRECGSLESWECPTDPDFTADDISSYFTDPKKAFLIKIKNELAGFILIGKLETMSEVDFYLSEFFILGKFQNRGMGQEVAVKLFNHLKGTWAVGVLPENKKALNFWNRVITEFSGDDYREVLKTKDELRTAEHPDPYVMNIFSFSNNTSKSSDTNLKIDNLVKPLDLNHITLACIDIERSFTFYKEVMGFKPLVKWDKGAYFLIGESWFCLNVDSNRKSNPCYTHYAFSVKYDAFKAMSDKISKSGAYIFKDNTSPGESLYFLDPDGHKLEIHVGNWKSRIEAKKENMGSWKNVEWFV